MILKHKGNTMYASSQYHLNFNPRRNVGYSGLENIAQDAVYTSSESTPITHYSAQSPGLPLPAYGFSMGSSSFLNNLNYNSFNNPNNNFQSYNSNPPNYLLTSPQPEYHFIPDDFLKPGKEGIFVGKAEEIKEFIEEAFEKINAEKFPADIKISVCNQEQFRKLAPHPATIGLSLNRRKQGLLSEIFVLNDSLARVMLTIGHELGHVLTETLEDKHDEEAKAYAFSLAWMKTIKEHNIANLGDAIVTERPADNGLHNIAFFFVEKLMKKGKEAWEVYEELVGKILMVKSTVLV